MHLKKLLFVLFLATASIACCDDKQPSSDDSQPQTSEQVAEPMERGSSAATQPPSPAPLPSSKEMTSSYENAFVRMLVTLLGLVFLVFVTFWVLRKLGKGKFKMGGGKAIQILERRALSQKTMLYVVEVDNKKILISESQLEVRTLTSLEEFSNEEIRAE
jgi:flagellar biogenesis protein FliO